MDTSQTREQRSLSHYREVLKETDIFVCSSGGLPRLLDEGRCRERWCVHLIVDLGRRFGPSIMVPRAIVMLLLITAKPSAKWTQQIQTLSDDISQDTPGLRRLPRCWWPVPLTGVYSSSSMAGAMFLRRQPDGELLHREPWRVIVAWLVKSWLDNYDVARYVIFTPLLNGKNWF